jgi:hypothetical protein
MVAASYRSPLENSGDPFIYIWGTPGGREGGVRLARVMPNQIEDLSSYRYFNGYFSGVPMWTVNEYDADSIVPSGVGEMSVMYNEALGAWTMMSISGGSQPDFEIRQAENPWGPWSDPILVADFWQAPGLYSPYMNPLYVEDGGRTLYFTMSLWDPYDVYLAKVTLDIEEPLSGDFDGDGDVDGRDFLIWQRGASPNSLSPEDLSDWQAHFGEMSQLSIAAIPEPSAVILVGMAVLFAGRRPTGFESAASREQSRESCHTLSCQSSPQAVSLKHLEIGTSCNRRFADNIDGYAQD